MSYSFNPSDENLAQGVRRIARSQIVAAIAEIDDESVDRVKTVHQVRKRCKKVRALARLVRPAFPDYRQVNGTFRDAASTLSGARDAQVMLETFDGLAKRFGAEFDAARFAPIRSALVDQRRRTSRSVTSLADDLTHFRRTMLDALQAADDWTIKASGPDAIEAGLAKSLKDGAKAFAKAAKKPDAEHMHELRKRVKDHWYHTRLLTPVWPEAMGARADELSRLADMLGDEHDLAVFDDALDAHGEAEDVAALRAFIARRRRELQVAGLALAERVYSGKAKAEARRFADLWRAWRSAPAIEDPADQSDTATPKDDAPIEIERKFLVAGDDWRFGVRETKHIRQGFLVSNARFSLRVRIIDGARGEVTLKSADASLVRDEITATVPVETADRLMAFAEGPVLEKARHVVPLGTSTVEVDEFVVPAGLKLAEIELRTPSQPIPHADWIGREVTGESAYYGANVAALANTV